MRLADVLVRGWPGAEWTLSGDDYAGLTWLSDGSKPSAAEVAAKQAEFEAAAPWDAVRVERGRLLRDSDWTQMPDAPLTAAEKQTWAVYRQTLRDIPQDFASPDAVVWPDAP